MKHPIIGNECLPREAYETVCRRIRTFYGVADAEAFFAAKRKEMLDKCTEDAFGWKRYATLKDWHESKVLAARLDPSNAGIHCAAEGRPVE